MSTVYDRLALLRELESTKKLFDSIILQRVLVEKLATGSLETEDLIREHLTALTNLLVDQTSESSSTQTDLDT